MIIKKLEIISFGKFANKVIEFSDGLNVVFGNNESGKSTIINFIYSMFYGFGDNRGKTLSLREKYTPWAGGVCEGKLTVKTDDGKNISIYRKAGNVKKYDILRVYNADTGEEYNESPEDIIGISSDTFFKALCIRQLSSAFEGNNDEITQRLSNIAQGGDESVNYEKAQKILESIRREIQPQRGMGGELSAIKSKISEIEKSRLDNNKIKAEIDAIDSVYVETEKDLLIFKEKTEKLKQNDPATKIAHLQGRLEETKNLNVKKGHVPFLSAGILFLVAFLITAFFSVSYSLIFIPFSVIFLVSAFIKSSPSANNNAKNLEAELETLILKKKNHDEEASLLKKAFDDTQRKLESLKIRKESLLLSLKKDEESGDEFIEAKRKLETKLHTINISMEALKRAHENMQSNFTPALSKKATEYFNQISEGKYSRIFCDKEFGVMIETDLPRESSFFSGGTVDQLYLSVRLALIDMLYPQKSCSILLDQPFLQYDNIRKYKAIELLKALPANRQILLFTSDEELISANKSTEMLT